MLIFDFMIFFFLPLALFMFLTFWHIFLLLKKTNRFGTSYAKLLEEEKYFFFLKNVIYATFLITFL